MSVDQYIREVNRIQNAARAKRKQQKMCGTGFSFWLHVYRFRPWPVRILMAIESWLL